MISKNQRLSKNRVEYLLKKGISKNNSFLGLKYLPNNLSFCRFSVVVSKKIAKLATERNLVRRQIYTILREFDSKSSNCHDLVLITRSNFAKLNYQQKQDKLEEILQSLFTNNHYGQ